MFDERYFTNENKLCLIVYGKYFLKYKAFFILDWDIFINKLDKRLKIKESINIQTSNNFFIKAIKIRSIYNKSTFREQ